MVQVVGIRAQEGHHAMLQQRRGVGLGLVAKVTGKAAGVALAEQSLLHPVQYAFRLLHEPFVPFGMGHHRDEAAQHELVQQLFHLVRPALVRQLHQDIAAAGQAVIAAVFPDELERIVVQLYLSTAVEL